MLDQWKLLAILIIHLFMSILFRPNLSLLSEGLLLFFLKYSLQIITYFMFPEWNYHKLYRFCIFISCILVINLILLFLLVWFGFQTLFVILEIATLLFPFRLFKIQFFDIGWLPFRNNWQIFTKWSCKSIQNFRFNFFSKFIATLKALH